MTWCRGVEGVATKSVWLSAWIPILFWRCKLFVIVQLVNCSICKTVEKILRPKWLIIQEVRVHKFSTGFSYHLLCSFLRGLIRYLKKCCINFTVEWKRILINPNPNQFFTSWTNLIDSQRPEENSIPKIPQQKGSTQSESGFSWKVIRGSFGFFKCLIHLPDLLSSFKSSKESLWLYASCCVLKGLETKNNPKTHFWLFSLILMRPLIQF